MPFDVGDSVPLAWDVADEDGNPVDAGTAVLTVYLPDGTTVTPSVPAPATTGQYRVTYVPATEGRYAWRAVTTVPSTSYQDVFMVREPASPSMLSLADGKRALNIPSTTTTFDDELREYLEAVTRVVEDYVGPVVIRTYTRRLYSCYYYTIRLPHQQVRSISSVTLVKDGSTISPADLSIDSLTGIVRYANMISVFPWGELDFTYSVGRDYVNPNLTLAAKLILQHNWQTQLGNLPAVQGEDDTYAWTGRLGSSGIPLLVPPRALALMSPENVGQGFA